MLRFFESIGERTIRFFRDLFAALSFSIECILHMLMPKSYHSATRSVLIKQIYFTAVDALVLFLSFAVLFGLVIVGVLMTLAMQYNLQDQIGSIVVTFVVDEVAPFFTAIVVSLRSATAVNTEIALMKINKELQTLQKYRIDIIDYLFIPRILGGIISVTSLASIFAIVMLLSGFLFAFFALGIDWYTYKKLLFQALRLSDVATLFAKSVAFGFVTMIFPIYSGLKASEGYNAIPKAVLNGMVRLFMALFFIEVISLLLQYL